MKIHKKSAMSKDELDKARHLGTMRGYGTRFVRKVNARENAKRNNEQLVRMAAREAAMKEQHERMVMLMKAKYNL